jgi:diguanylate cyclase
MGIVQTKRRSVTRIAIGGFVSVEYSEGVELAQEYAERALELMKSNNIPATPRNFAIWYTYVNEKYPDLKKTLDGLIKNKQVFTSQQNDEVYDKYFTNTEEGIALQETSQKIEYQVGRVLDMMGDASGGVADFNKTLTASLGALANTKGMEGIREAVQSLAMETQKMQQSNSALQSKLKDSSQEIAHLRQNLEDVQREAMTDALTGIANRKMFDTTLRQRAMEAKEDGEPLCLALADIDFFKKFNDTYGHQTGDQVLKLVAHILRSNVKGKDLAARYGGEEFALILPSTKLQDAKTVCDHIRNAVSTKRIRNRTTGEEMGTITLSIGIALYQPGESLTDLIHRSDEGLYFAKGNGRNQTVLETQLEVVDAE